MSEKTKNRYSQVDLVDEIDSDTIHPGGSERNLFAPKSLRFGPRFQMVALVLVGVALMIIHHTFYLYLDGRPHSSSSFTLGNTSLMHQTTVGVLGNAIAYAARVVLSAAIGVACIQVFWSMLRRGRYSVTQVDAFVACRSSPFALPSLPTWHHAFFFALLASMAAVMALIPTLAPSSLRIASTDFQYPCTVPTVSLSTSNIAFTKTANDTEFVAAKGQIMKSAARVLMTGEPLPPINPCPGACNYVISFNAPVANCTPYGLGDELASWLPPPNSSTGRYPVWSAGVLETGSLVVAARDLLRKTYSTVSCATYNGTYTVEITHSNTTSSTARVLYTKQHELIDVYNTSSEAQYDAVIVAFQTALVGWVEVDTNEGDPSGIYNGDNVLVGYSPAFSGTSETDWNPTSDISTEISSFMQNISVSLLSGQLLEAGEKATSNFETYCLYPTSTYIYNRVQLLAVYGGALGITVLSVFAGFWSIRQNGTEESFSFSRIVGAILNKTLFEDRYQLAEGSQITANGSVDGQLRLVHTTYS